MHNICTIVVTYNRKDLLQECLDAILEQTVPVKSVFVIDNASTDGTREILETKYTGTNVVPVFMESNTGGAGGFYEGIKRGSTGDYDWIWLMDDDTIPTPDCLEKLLNAAEAVNKDVSFLASSVYGPNHEFMNVPEIDMHPSPNGYTCWYEKLDRGMIKISSATFVSLLIKKEAITKCGLPCRDFFIWGDDSEYTSRLTNNYGPAYLVGESVAIHKRKDTKILTIENETNQNRIKMFHYMYRNRYICKRYYLGDRFARSWFLKEIIRNLSLLRKPMGRQKAGAVYKGLFEGKLQYKAFKNYIDEQVVKGI